MDIYRKDVHPALEAALKDVKLLFERGDPSVDVLRVLDVQRKLLRTRDGEVDALYELRQAQADLGAAIADPSITAILPPAR